MNVKVATKKVVLEIKNCLDCPHHSQRRDPDPNDWFCDDDMKVVCTKTTPERVVTSAERPYNLRRECAVPPWCPL